MPSTRCNGRRTRQWRTWRRAGYSATANSSRPIARRGWLLRTSRRLARAASAQFPFRLNTGRMRDQWHTMTRSGLEPAACAACAEPFVEVHPADAAHCRLANGGFARLRSPYGTCVLKVVVTEGQRRGSLFAPIHWSDETASCARIGELVTPATDPYSGQPEGKATPAAIRPVDICLSRVFAGDASRWRCLMKHGGRG